jgi:hypothetical protein
MLEQVPAEPEGLAGPIPVAGTAAGDLGLPHRGGGGCGRARDQWAALVPVRERVLGAEHPDTLAARASLAHWTRRAQNPE